METKEEREAFERYELIVSLVGEYAEDKKGQLLRLIEQLVQKCADYIRSVNRMELFQQLNRYRLEPLDYQARVTEHDARRRIAHNALIDQLYIVNRNLFTNEDLKDMVPIGGIYSLDPGSIEDRYAVARWARYLVSALARHGVVKV